MKTGLSVAVLFLAMQSLSIAQTDLQTANANSSRVCATEGGINVCRNVVAKREVVRVEEIPFTLKGKLFLLLDIPANIFARLAAPPETNREYHPTPSFEYHPAPPAPQGASAYRPLRDDGDPVWRYQPKASFKYTPKRDWSYNRDVFGRLWRANIEHDTRVVEVPIEEPFIVLKPTAEVR